MEIAWLEFELIYFEVTVQYFIYDPPSTPPDLELERIILVN